MRSTTARPGRRTGDALPFPPPGHMPGIQKNQLLADVDKSRSQKPIIPLHQSGDKEMGALKENRRMALTMLHILSTTELPLTVKGGSDVDAVHILLLGGHVQANMAKAVRAPTGWEHPTATVTEITKIGRRMLRVFPIKFAQI